MVKKLYVGNLSFETTEEQLHELFQKEGEVVSAKLITDKFSGRSRGFGFVEMNDTEADAAITKLNDTEVNGRKLVVNEARPMEKRAPGGGGFGGGGGRRGGPGGGSRHGGFGGGGRRGFEPR